VRSIRLYFSNKQRCKKRPIPLHPPRQRKNYLEFLSFVYLFKSFRVIILSSALYRHPPPLYLSIFDFLFSFSFYPDTVPLPLYAFCLLCIYLLYFFSLFYCIFSNTHEFFVCYAPPHSLTPSLSLFFLYFFFCSFQRLFLFLTSTYVYHHSALLYAALISGRLFSINNIHIHLSLTDTHTQYYINVLYVFP
jgi:hypothetical protein